MNIFKKKMENTSIFYDYTDWHSHLLPGVDDGIKTIDDSIMLLNRYEELGVRHVWLTPHIMEDIPNTTKSLRQQFDKLSSRYTGNIRLSLAAENMLDNLFENRLEKDDLLPIGTNGDHLLVETSYYNSPVNFWNILDRIQRKGYHVLLAHPERYRYMDKSDYERLKEMKVKLQLNVPSLIGFYGHEAKKKSEWLINNGYYDTTGYDLHSARALEFILNGEISKKYLKQLTSLINNQQSSHPYQKDAD